MDTSGIYKWGTYFYAYNPHDQPNIYDLCVNQNGTVCISGQTSTGLPITSNSILFKDLTDSSKSINNPLGFTRGFVAEFNNTGTLEFCSYIGGRDQATIESATVSIDKFDNIYFWGTTQDTLFPEVNYPLSKQYYFSKINLSFSFLLKIKNNHSIVWCDYFYLNEGFTLSLDLDTLGCIYSTGIVDIYKSKVKPSLQLDTGTNINTGNFVIKTDSLGILKYSFTVNKISVYGLYGARSSILDQNNNAYFISENIPDSSSEDKGFANGSFSPSKLYPEGNSQLKVLELNPEGKLINIIPFGGSYCDFIPAWTVEPSGGLWVMGLTTSPDFPVSSNSLQPAIDSSFSGFICHFTRCDIDSLNIPIHKHLDSICQSPSITLDAGIDNVLYSWSNGWNTKTINVSDSGIYSVQIYDGCREDTIYFHVKKVDCNGYFYVPNAFSPNNDGVNDVFKPEGANITQLSMVIVNRWGEVVSTISDMNGGWNGKFRGSICPPGVYGYTLTAKSTTGEWIYRKGDINLIR